MDLNARPEELLHYGVLGMKWGVRKDRRVSVSAEGAHARELRKKKASELTNAELKVAAERLRLEKEYNRLTAGPSYKNALTKALTSPMAELGMKSGSTYWAKLLEKDGKTKAAKVLTTYGPMIVPTIRTISDVAEAARKPKHK